MCSLSFSRPDSSIFSKLNKKNIKRVFDTLSKYVDEKQRIAVVTENCCYNTLIVLDYANHMFLVRLVCFHEQTGSIRDSPRASTTVGTPEIIIDRRSAASIY